MAVTFPYTDEELKLMDELHYNILQNIKELRHLIYQHNYSKSPIYCKKLNTALDIVESVRPFIDSAGFV